MQLLASIRQFVAEHELIPPESRVLAAVSGGSDSTALAYILSELQHSRDFTFAGLVHFNHQLRASADRDEQFVRDLAASLRVDIFVDREDVASRARRERRSLEHAARAARYEFFDRARARAASDLVALGHTRDDQAETVLLRLMRGAGPRGLAGMHPRNGAVVRPLLHCRRADLRAWLLDRGARFVEDETNQDVAIPRNRVRAELLPMLAERFNASIVDVLADQAELARDMRTWMDAQTSELCARAVHAVDAPRGAIARTIDIAVLSAAPAALQRALLWRVMREAAGGRSIDFHHVEAARRLIDHDINGCIDVPGQRVERIGGRVVLTGRQGHAGRPTREPPNLFRYSLSIPGEVIVPDAGVVAVSESDPSAAVSSDLDNCSDRHVAIVRGDLCAGTLAVRNRRPGDRFQPAGLKGRKKLQDYFVDRKVPRERRDAVPIVVDASDRIVWIAGHQIDDAFRVTDRSQGVLILTFKAVGGSA